VKGRNSLEEIVFLEVNCQGYGGMGRGCGRRGGGRGVVVKERMSAPTLFPGVRVQVYRVCWFELVVSGKSWDGWGGARRGPCETYRCKGETLPDRAQGGVTWGGQFKGACLPRV